VKTERFNLGNLCCVSCADEVERVVRAQPGVNVLSVYLLGNAWAAQEIKAPEAFGPRCFCYT
jgi:copper chaperone CopZ